MAQRYLSDEQLGKIKQLNQLAEERGQTLAQMAIAWILRRPEVTTVLVGCQQGFRSWITVLRRLSARDFRRIELKKDRRGSWHKRTLEQAHHAENI